MTSPAMGTITFSDSVRIMEKIPAFHPCGVCPTSAAIVPTFSFTSPNIVDRLPFMDNKKSSKSFSDLLLSLAAGSG